MRRPLDRRMTSKILDHAREVLAQWNAEHPDRPAPWEWLEEALLARRDWRLATRRARSLRLAARLRYLEFARRLPPDLIHLALGRPCGATSR